MQDVVKLAVGFCFAAFLLTYNVAQAGIYDFKGGVRVPAGSCVTYLDKPNTNVVSADGGIRLSNSTGPIGARCVCQLPVPERAKIRQFVMVGNVSSKGEIFAYISSVPWNQPRQVPFYANISLLPTTPYEIPAVQQKKVVRNLPIGGSESLTIDRINTYFIEAEFKTPEAVSAQDALELFYFEVYWDY